MGHAAAFGYIRCAPEEDDDSFLGVPAQLHAIQAYARFRRATLQETFVDRATAPGVPLEAREEGARLVERLRRPDARGAAVLAYQLERTFSSVSEGLALLEEWHAREIVLHVLDLDGSAIHTASPVGRFMVSVLASAQTMEAEAARERTRTLRAKRARAGGAKPLLGERVVRGYIVPDPDEMRAVTRIRELSEAGKSLRHIADTLDEEGVPTKRRAGHWSKESIRLILRRIHAGEVRSLRREGSAEGGTATEGDSAAESAGGG